MFKGIVSKKYTNVLIQHTDVGDLAHGSYIKILS